MCRAPPPEDALETSGNTSLEGAPLWPPGPGPEGRLGRSVLPLSDESFNYYFEGQAAIMSRRWSQRSLLAQCVAPSGPASASALFGPEAGPGSGLMKKLLRHVSIGLSELVRDRTRTCREAKRPRELPNAPCLQLLID